MIDRLAIEGYRSIRSLALDLAPLTVVTGRNGAGKSNLYRALRLLADCGEGRVVAALAASGGIDGVRWAGPDSATATQGTVRRDAVALRLGFGAEGDVGYAIDLGLPVSASGGGFTSAFDLDPHIKQEHVFAGLDPRPASVLVERKGQLVRSRDGRGWVEVARGLAPWMSVLDQVAGDQSVPELAGVRRTLRGWRFHDAMRTDPDAPARRTQIATRSPRLDDDGGNVAAVLRTTIEQGDDTAVTRALDEAFPGSRLVLDSEGGRMQLALQQPRMLRPLGAHELSDGTMQHLLLTAALTSIERPSLTVLNEPERSLHRELVPALAGLVARAASDAQVLVVTHDAVLVEHLARAGASLVELERSGGETTVAGREGMLDVPAWHWPRR